jgi:hypothetical protein
MSRHQMITLQKNVEPDFSQFQILTEEFKKIQVSMDEFRNNIIKPDFSSFQILTAELNKIRDSIDEFLNNIQINYPEETSLPKNINATDYLAILNLGESGVTDISENHDSYLGEIVSDEHIR